MDVTRNLTIVIPFRIDSTERERNLNLVVKFLLEYTQAEIIILEADIISRYAPVDHVRLSYYFVFDNKRIFHRTHYINQLLHLSKTEIVGVWDTDVLLPTLQINSAVCRIMEGNTMCFPYKEKFINLTAKESLMVYQNTKKISEFESKTGNYSVGGAFVVNKRKYLLAGGENETFYGWGPEDIERVKRLEILGYRIDWISGNIYHLYHPRGINSKCDDKNRDRFYLQTLLNICCMSREKLSNHIKTWNYAHTTIDMKKKNNHAISNPLKNKEIPKIIHQIWGGNNPLPEHLKKMSESWKIYHPDWKYEFWDDERIQRFVEKYYPEYLDKFNNFKYNMQRWDCARYMILNIFGGVYADFDSICIKPINDLINNNYCFFSLEPDRSAHHNGKIIQLATSIFGSIPDHPFLTVFLKTIFSEFKSYEFKDINTKVWDVITSTGPVKLTEVFEDYPRKEQIRLISHEYLLNCEHKNVVSVLDIILTKDFINKLKGYSDKTFAVHFYFYDWFRGNNAKN